MNHKLSRHLRPRILPALLLATLASAGAAQAADGVRADVDRGAATNARVDADARVEAGARATTPDRPVRADGGAAIGIGVGVGAGAPTRPVLPERPVRPTGGGLL